MPRSRSQHRIANPALRRLLRQMEKYVQRLQALLAAEGVALPAEEPPARLHEVTPTEWKVWRLIADPKDEKYEVIYPTLGMRKRNFDKHVNSLFHKLGVHKRSGAARLWAVFGKGQRGGILGRDVTRK